MRHSKPCTRPECGGIIHAARPSRLRVRKYCSHKCSLEAGKAAKLKGQDDAAIRRAVRSIQQALGVTGDASPALVRAVRTIRTRAYTAGYMCVRRTLQRAVIRGILIHRRPGVAA